MKNKQL